MLLALAIIPQIILVRLLSNHPEFVERYYSNGIYEWLAKLFRFVLGWLPFSFGDFVYTFTLIYGLRWLYKNRKRLRKDTKHWFIDVAAALSFFYFAFHLFWGMNYHRLPLHKNLGLQHDYNTEQLLKVTENLIKKSNDLHIGLVDNDSLPVLVPYTKAEIFDKIPDGYKALKATFPNLDYSPVSIKKSLFSYPLTYMGFSGYLNPLTNEAHVDGLVPIYKYPTTAAHEIAHQLGYAAENEANFIGFLASISHHDDYIKYTGYTFGLRFCLNEVYRRNEALYEVLIKTVNPGILKNYEEIRIFWEAHQNPAEPFFKMFYGGYLKANKQSKGMESYSYVVALLVNYLNGKTL
ncbi:DUF3810 domain-containing protein [Cognatitamlana onchidii]|uniref:DUF3810 domain-containing protein n=1 Tax=Cognatitamlana onchidii TaxID=2562860 RepID=UPI001F3BB78D|nr:DUF3810 domain-containing protein [Algibacter onchidii]